MINFFRKTRKKLAQDNKPAKYLRYAIGEIALVVIGILIALSINNKNELRKHRVSELHYLSNIKKDLKLNLKDLEVFIGKREAQITSAKEIIYYHEGKTLDDLVDFNMNCINVYTWKKFNLNHNAFTELVNSGNLALISNDSIKNLLLGLEALNDKLKYTEEHFRYDCEQLLYPIVYEKVDMYPTVESFVYNLSDGAAGTNADLSKKDFKVVIKSMKHKNGMALAIYEFGVMKQNFEEMRALIFRLMKLIDNEIQLD